MKRREFITLVGGAAASMPLTARAQRKAVPVIGFLSPGPPGAGGPLLGGFRLGLSETGYTEGQNVCIEYHWVEANEKLAPMAADLVGRKVDLIVAITDSVARAAQSASSHFSAAMAVLIFYAIKWDRRLRTPTITVTVGIPEWW